MCISLASPTVLDWFGSTDSDKRLVALKRFVKLLKCRSNLRKILSTTSRIILLAITVTLTEVRRPNFVSLSAVTSLLVITPAFTHDVLVTSSDTRSQTLRQYAEKRKVKVKGKVSPYSLPSVGSRADPGVQAVSPQVTWSESRHRPGSRLPLLSARPAVIFHQMALPVNGSTHLIPAYYSFIDPERMKGWVGLVVADGLATLVVTHQLQVERRTGKVRQSETDVLPLCHATN